MFWKKRVLVDKLISFLDVESVARLGEAHQPTAQVLQGSTTWVKLVKRSCPYFELPMEEDSYEGANYPNWLMERVSTHETNISHLTGILRKMENPKVPLLELLHVICNRFPPVIFSAALEDSHPMAFHLRCPCKRSHSVTHLGFLLLEKVEESLNSAEQEVETVFLHHLSEPWLSALEARASRQQKIVEKVEAFTFLCDEVEEIDKLLSLRENCKTVTIPEVIVRGGFDGKGDQGRLDQDFWAKMARALEPCECLQQSLGVDAVRATRYDLQGGSRQDLRAIWDAMGAYADGYSSLDVNAVLFENKSGVIHFAWNSETKENYWEIFQLILDTPPEQWPRNWPQQLQYEDSSFIEDSSDSESESD